MSSMVVVVGDGWSALGTVAFLALSGVPVHWITGLGTRVLAPLASLDAGFGVEIWAELATRLGLDGERVEARSWLREFKHKSFRKPVWENSDELKNRELWKPEQRLVAASQVRFRKTLEELSEEIREVLDKQFPQVKKTSGLALAGIQVVDQRIRSVILTSGETISCDQVYYADRWSLLTQVEGLPRPLPFLSRREPVGLLQVTLSHPDFGPGVGTTPILENFFIPLHRESGEEIERKVWGYFWTSGKKSTWSLCLTHDEGENNHEITKKLRRLKNAVDKAFSTSGWILSDNRLESQPEGKPESKMDKKSFSEFWVDEQVRFSEEAVFSGGAPLQEAIRLGGLSGLHFLADGYGPTGALLQVASTLGINPGCTNPQSESVDSLDPIELEGHRGLLQSPSSSEKVVN